jgi:hypothetical protein
MENDTSELTKNELQERICELEHAYAELLGDRADATTLNMIWKEIQLLQATLNTEHN